MTETISKYIQNELANDELDDDLDIHDDLLGSGIVDSMGMMKLVIFIETAFEVQVPPEDMTIENFMTINHITEYLASKK